MQGRKGTYKEDVDAEVRVATSFEEDSERREDDGEDDFANARRIPVSPSESYDGL